MKPFLDRTTYCVTCRLSRPSKAEGLSVDRRLLSRTNISRDTRGLNTPAGIVFRLDGKGSQNPHVDNNTKQDYIILLIFGINGKHIMLWFWGDWPVDELKGRQCSFKVEGTPPFYNVVKYDECHPGLKRIKLRNASGQPFYPILTQKYERFTP